MSALDQAFIKAYANKPLTEPSSRSPANGPANAAQSEPAESLYQDGVYYRTDVPAAKSSIPTPHILPSVRTGNTLRSRYTRTAAEPEPRPAAPAPSPPEPTLLPRSPRIKNPSLEQLAERLSGSVAQPDIEIDLPQPTSAPVVPVAVETNSISVVATGYDQTAELTASIVTEVVAPVFPASPPATDKPSTKKSFRIDPPVAPAAEPEPSLPIAPQVALDLGPLEAALTAPVVVNDKPQPDAPPQRRLDAPQQLRGPHFRPTPAAEPTAPITPAAPAVSAVEASPKPLAETPSAETPTASAAWEVDALQWPTVTDELLSNTQSYFSQAGKKLASAVHDGLKVLGVLGCVRGEGCSTLAMTLARAAAREGINVALVDGDLAEPQLAQRTSLEMSGGWHEAARGQTKIAETAIKSLADKLTFYPLEPAADLSLTDARVSKAWQQIAQRHTLVILDLGPAGSGDTPIFATTEPPPVDAVVIVRDIRRTSLDQVHALAQRLHKQGIDAVGMAENFVGTPST